MLYLSIRFSSDLVLARLYPSEMFNSVLCFVAWRRIHALFERFKPQSSVALFSTFFASLLTPLFHRTGSLYHHHHHHHHPQCSFISRSHHRSATQLCVCVLVQPSRLAAWQTLTPVDTNRQTDRQADRQAGGREVMLFGSSTIKPNLLSITHLSVSVRKPRPRCLNPLLCSAQLSSSIASLLCPHQRLTTTTLGSCLDTNFYQPTCLSFFLAKFRLNSIVCSHHGQDAV